MSCYKINKMCELNVSLETLREQADSHWIPSVATPHPHRTCGECLFPSFYWRKRTLETLDQPSRAKRVTSMMGHSDLKTFILFITIL